MLKALFLVTEPALKSTEPHAFLCHTRQGLCFSAAHVHLCADYDNHNYQDITQRNSSRHICCEWGGGRGYSDILRTRGDLNGAVMWRE